MLGLAKTTKEKAKDKEKVIKCYYCGSVIEYNNQLVEKRFPLACKGGKIRNFRRKFHIDCLPKYLEGVEDKELLSEENDDWKQVYNYFRKEILELPETKPLQKHEIQRLLGLRLGQYYPSGTNTRVLPRGYDFKTILITLKVIKPKLRGYASHANYVNHKHRVDSIMRFVTGEINDVQKRLDMQNKSNEKLEKDVIKEGFDYLSKLKEQKKKEKVDTGINKDIQALFGGEL